MAMTMVVGHRVRQVVVPVINSILSLNRQTNQSLLLSFSFFFF